MSLQMDQEMRRNSPLQADYQPAARAQGTCSSGANPIENSANPNRWHVSPRSASPDRLSRLRDMLTECNFLFGLVGDEEQLLSGICHLIVQAGGFERAWVRLAAGPTDGQPAENVPPNGALHIQKDYYFAASYPARSSSMLTNQHQSCLGLPLKDGLSTLGELNLYNTDIEPLDQQEIGLLNQLAANLAFCLLALRDQQRTARRQTQLSSREPGRQPLLVLLNG